MCGGTRPLTAKVAKVKGAECEDGERRECEDGEEGRASDARVVRRSAAACAVAYALALLGTGRHRTAEDLVYLLHSCFAVGACGRCLSGAQLGGRHLLTFLV